MSGDAESVLFYSALAAMYRAHGNDARAAVMTEAARYWAEIVIARGCQ